MTCNDPNRMADPNSVTDPLKFFLPFYFAFADVRDLQWGPRGLVSLTCSAQRKEIKLLPWRSVILSAKALSRETT